MTIKCNLDKEMRVYLDDHQVLLSFMNDEDAHYFEDWWHDQGIKQFIKHVDDEKEKYGEL